jgi:hypothetical protein
VADEAITITVNEKVVVVDTPAPSGRAGMGWSVWSNVVYHDHKPLGVLQLPVDQLGPTKHLLTYVPYE